MGNVITDMLQTEYVWVSGCYNPLYYIIYHYIIYTHMLYLYIQSVKTVCDPLRHPLFSNFTAHRSRSFDLPCIVAPMEVNIPTSIGRRLEEFFLRIITQTNQTPSQSKHGIRQPHTPWQWRTTKPRNGAEKLPNVASEILCQQKLSHNDIIHMYLTSMYIYIHVYFTYFI